MNLTKLLNAISHKEVLVNLPDAVLVVELDGRICWANKKAATLFEVETSILQNCNVDDLVTDGMKIIAKSANKRTSVITAAVSASSRELFIELSARFYDDQYYVTLRDVTAMTAVFDNAEETNRLTKDKNLMLEKLSTDLKSPLQSMLGFSQALLDGLGGDITEKQEKYIKIINKNANDMLFFMDKLLDFSQSEANYFRPELQTFDILNAVQSVLRANEVALSLKNLTLNLDSEDFDRKTIYSDEHFLKAILQNILETSIKLTEIGSVSVKITYAEQETVDALELDTKHDKKYMQIAITDTGIGLTETEKEDLFNPYQHLDKVNKKNIVRAFSLGTALNLAEKLNGTITVKSEVMKGSTYNVILPVDKEEDE